MLVAEEQQRSDHQELAVAMNVTNVAIGFHAMLSSSGIHKRPTPIKYTNVRVNKGNRYSPSTGKFTADRAGLYFFEQYWVTAEGNNHYYHSLYIYKNGNTLLCESYGNPAGASNNYRDMNAPSCSAVVELQVGDEVYVISDKSSDVYSDEGHDVGSYESTGFNGFLIRSYV